MKYLLLISVLIIAQCSISQQQAFEIESSVAPEINVCDNAQSFSVNIKNATNAITTNPEITIVLPPGIEYTPNSLAEVTNNNLVAVDVSSSQNLRFSCNPLNVGDSTLFSFSYTAETAAISFQDQGEIFRNEIQVNSDTAFSESYNILYPVLSVLSVNPSNQTFLSGASITRQITVINGGTGRTDRLVISDVRNSSLLTLDTSSLGTIAGDSIILESNDFINIGNGDGYLDQNESFVLEQTLSGTACSDITVTSTIKTHWGCSGNPISSSNNFANTTIDFRTPNIKLQATGSLDACFGTGVASPQELRIISNGTGIANQLAVDIYKSTGGGYNQNIYTRFDPNSFQYKIGANGAFTSPLNMITTATNSSGNYSCLGNSPIGRVQFDVPNLSPGDTVFIVWDMYSCCISTCSNDAVKGWRAEVDYTDICQANSYSKSITGQNENSQSMSFFTESPADIVNGQTEVFSFIVSGLENSLPVGNVATYEAILQLDDGLVFEDLSFHSNNVVWTPISVDYNTGTNTVTAVFPEDAPFIIPKSTLDVSISGNCGSSGWKIISLDFNYIPETNCSSGSCSIPLECNVTTSTYLHCPSGSCNSLSVLDYNLQRISFGLPDNNIDGYPDNSGALDMNVIKTNRAMTGDTIVGRISSVIGNTTETWNYGQLITSVDYGSVLNIIDATVTIYDASSSSFIVVNNVSGMKQTSGNTANFTFDLSINALSTLNSALIGYEFSANDSISVDVRYHVANSVAGLIQEATFINDFFLSDYANPTASQKEKCNFKNARLTLIGYTWRNNSPNNVTVKSCSKTVHQYFGLSIGNTGSNYAGGNLFPSEYRQWGTIEDIQMVIPPNYSHVSTQIKWYRTRRTNSIITQTLNGLTPDAINGDTLYYDLQQLFDTGTLQRGDDGFHGKITVELAPNCDVPENTYQDIDWTFNYSKTEAIDGNETGYISAVNPDRIRFQRSSLQLSSNNPWQDANQRSVVWDYRIKNTSSSGADNAWIHLEVPPNITIDSIVNDNTGAILTLQNDIYLAGTINAGATGNFSIHGTFTNCDSVLLLTYAGYECTGYPSDFASFTCPYEYMPLYVEPKPSAYQTRISNQVDNDPCTNQVELTIDITSVKIAHMYDMQVQLITPDPSRIAVIPGSSEFQYNTSNAYESISDPTFSNNSYRYTIKDFEPSFEVDGIPGVFDIANNRYRLRMTIELGSNFEKGDFLQIQIDGNNACAVPLPQVNLAYDPSISFVINETAGLNNDAVSNWSASWGDYNNDGYDDLFVPSRDYAVKNLLYLNNQDGTFTKIVSGPVVNDLGASVTGTWGDYDNDGYLDLFVANNENSPNRLYHNNQDGTFTAITSGAIVEEGIYSHSAAWADYNKDGNLDIVISDFHATHFNRLLYGDGTGNFTLDETSPISQSATSALGVSWGDYDNDGDQDLFIANTNGENNQLFRNDAGAFVEITTGPVVNDGGTSVGGVWGDYDNDGDLDLLVTNSSDIDPNFLYENNGNGTFTRILTGSLVNAVSNSHGASWIDFDNDRDLDVYIVNDQNNANFLFANDGSGNFTQITNALTEEASNSYGTAWSDFDNDGDYDLFVANTGAATNEFFVNEKGACTNFIGVYLQGCVSNATGIGAVIRAKSTVDGVPNWQTQHVSTQTSALGGQNSNKIIFGLADASSVDSVIILWPSGIRTEIANPAINQIHTINEMCGSKICGVVYHDINENGTQDIGEIGIPNQRITITPGNIEAYTNQNGEYVAYVTDGVYEIALVTDSTWSQYAPVSSYSVSVDQSQQMEYCGNDFGNTAVCIYPDLTISGGVTAFRRGLSNDLNIVVENRGAYATNGSVELELTMTDLVVIKSQDWIEQIAPTGFRIYTKTLSGLDALSDTTLYVEDSVSVSSNLDETVILSGKVRYTGNECDSTNNTFSITDQVVGSIDPNDKLVFVQGRGVSKYAHKEEKLMYKIRFQNIGNYSAQRVAIEDTLSDLLDWDRVTVASSSHDFTFTRNGNVLHWINTNIELPDSLSDPEGSQGYVSFFVYPKHSIGPFETIRNKAAIQFDYNEYLITNTVETTIVPNGDLEIRRMGYVYPNPGSDAIEILLLDEDGRRMIVKEVAFLNSLGQSVKKKSCNASSLKMDVSDLAQGVYTIRLVAMDEGITTTQFVKR